MSVCGPCYHGGPYKSPESDQSSETMLVFEGRAAVGITVMSRPGLLLRALSRSVVLLELGFVLISGAQVTTGSHRDHMC